MPKSFSDHDPVLLTLQISKQNPKGHGYWKLNTSILPHKVFKKYLNIFWKNWQRKKQNIISLINGGN